MNTRTDMTDEELKRDETISLIAADKVEGTAVFNADDEKIGTVDKVMIDKHSGRVSYAVMSFGGFLGIGESYHPLPWDTLTYDDSRDGYVVNLTREQLDSAPHFERNNEPDWNDIAYGQHVHSYYGLPPFGGPVR